MTRKAVRRDGSGAYARGAEAFGVFAVDPGGKTGTACGAFLLKDSLASTLRLHSPGVSAEEWEGNTVDQAMGIWRDFCAFTEACGAAGIQRVDLVIESFQLRTQRVELSPVEVTYALRGIRATYAGALPIGRLIWQTPSQAKGFATSARLKTWGLYAHGVGSDHKRDALKHLALRVARRLKEDEE